MCYWVLQGLVLWSLVWRGKCIFWQGKLSREYKFERRAMKVQKGFRDFIVPTVKRSICSSFLLFLCSWDCRISGLRITVFHHAGKLCACYCFQSCANRQPRLRYETNLSWDFALMLTWSDVLTFAFSGFAVQRLDCDMSRQKQNAGIPL